MYSTIKKILPIGLVIIALSLTVTTFAAITVTKDIQSQGTVTVSPSLQAYSDSDCTNALSTVDWDSVAAGTNATQTIYLKNIGTGNITLSLSTNTWTPAGADTYITISWDKEGTSLAAEQSTAATLTLAISPAITGITDFSNDIRITGTG